MNASQWLSLWEQYRLVLLACLFFFLGLWVHYRWIIFRKRSMGFHSRRKGQKAERRAFLLLEKNGFEVLEDQPRFQTELDVDGDLRAFDITPDFLVAKDGIQFVVEVKRTNGEAIARASNRRQVIEYLMATGLPCLLVNMSSSEIQVVDFCD